MLEKFEVYEIRKAIKKAMNAQNEVGITLLSGSNEQIEKSQTKLVKAEEALELILEHFTNEN